MKKLLLNSIAILLGTTGWSQSPMYKSELPIVDHEGFYRIILTPDIIAKSLPGLPDIRLNEKKGNPVPYVLKTEIPVSTTRQFIEFPVVSIKKETDQLTHVTLKNATSHNVNELLLYVRNTVANRTISLSGSNDSLQWFIIRENVPIEGYYHEKDLFIQSVQLPLTAYKYYEIIVNGKNMLPVDIFKAGVNEELFANGNYQQLPSPVVHQQVKEKATYVDIVFNDHYQVDQLSIKISKPKYFKREATVYDGNSLLGSFAISSGSPIIIPVHSKSNQLRLKIDNQDNQALTIDSIQAFQLIRSLISYLDKGTSYDIFFGDSAATAPNYDLAAFSDSAGKNITILNPGIVQKINSLTPDKDKKDHNKLLLWIITGIILVILLFVTLKMTKEVNKKDKN